MSRRHRRTSAWRWFYRLGSQSDVTRMRCSPLWPQWAQDAFRLGDAQQFMALRVCRNVNCLIVRPKSVAVCPVCGRPARGPL